MFSQPPSLPSVPAGAVPADAYLVDVRERDEWDAGHIPDARHIPLSELSQRAGEIPQDRQVHVVCKIGGRSAHAVAALNANGWDTVNVDGGMLGWATANRPMVSETGDQPTVL